MNTQDFLLGYNIGKLKEKSKVKSMITDITVNKNKRYTIPEEEKNSIIGYKQVTVQVPVEEEPLIITSNGCYSNYETFEDKAHVYNPITINCPSIDNCYNSINVKEGYVQKKYWQLWKKFPYFAIWENFCQERISSTTGEHYWRYIRTQVTRIHKVSFDIEIGDEYEENENFNLIELLYSTNDDSLITENMIYQSKGFYVPRFIKYYSVFFDNPHNSNDVLYTSPYMYKNKNAKQCQIDIYERPIQEYGTEQYKFTYLKQIILQYDETDRNWYKI